MNVKMAPQKRALIVGVTGQDGAYLTKFLVDKNYEIYGTSRDLENSNSGALRYLDVQNCLTKVQLDPSDYDSVYKIIESTQPDEIYNLSAQSSVSLSFIKPGETINSITLGTLNILESLRRLKLGSKFYNAGSSEVFGDTKNSPADENTEFRPVSPYALGKAYATQQVSMYRNLYNIFACTGILFNHESPLRPDKYVTKKIISAACRIGNGSCERLKLGNINIYRDWGYAPEYVDAMWRMLQIDKPQDFVISTGTSTSLKQFIAEAFEHFDLDWMDYVDFDSSLLRSSDIEVSSSNPAKATSLLGWSAESSLSKVVEHMMRFEIDRHASK
jgi:GDPmannose 4,6-dehydratase